MSNRRAYMERFSIADAQNAISCAQTRSTGLTMKPVWKTRWKRSEQAAKQLLRGNKYIVGHVTRRQTASSLRAVLLQRL